jgi:hypothetical protein
VEKQVKKNASLKLEAVETPELLLISGGIWDYSNRLGPYLGQMLEDAQDGKYGNVLGVTTLDGAAHRALEGWVSIP